MQKPTLDDTAAVFQAGMTVETYFNQAIDLIDKRFGDGYAVRNPALIAECIRSQTLDFNTTAHNAVLYDISHALEGLPSAIREIGESLCDIAIHPAPIPQPTP